MTVPASGGPVVGHLRTAPPVTSSGDVATVDCRGIYYTYVNDAVRRVFDEGAHTVRLDNVNGQRYIGTGLSGEGRRIEVHLSLIHISEPTRLGMISYAVFCLK